MLAQLVSILNNAWFIAIGLFALGSCIFVHELGHFLAARRRGLQVDRFSIGFGPRVFGWTRNGVDYRLSLIPFGGYVALPQLADMGRLEDAEGDEAPRPSPLPPISYADKMIVAVMGAVFNLIFGLILAFGLWIAGETVALSYQHTLIGHVAETVETEDGEKVPSPAQVAGLRAGDRITHIDGVPVKDWSGVRSRIITGIGRSSENQPRTRFTVIREGQEETIDVLPILAGKEGMRQVGIVSADLLKIGERIEPQFSEILQPEDRILAFDNREIFSLSDIYQRLDANQPETFSFVVQRGDAEPFTINTTPTATELPEGGTRFDFGFDFRYQTEVIHPNPVTQFATKMELMYLTLRALVTPASDVKLRNMSGPVGIVDNFQESARFGWKPVVWMLVFVNINLAILNLLPIPVLDGGHMLFATIAKVTGRPLPRRLMEGLQTGFALLLFSFMIYVTFFDLGRVADKIAN